MESIKIDKSKLRTVKSYSQMMGVTVQQVYNWIKDQKVEMVKIDGVIFIKL